jgi:hypothetical protein
MAKEIEQKKSKVVKSLRDRQTDFYVYALADPENDEIFYIGKGCGNRVKTHVRDAIKGKILNAEKHKRIIAIIENGGKVHEIIIESGMTEPEAFKFERDLIHKRKSLLLNIHNGIMTNVEINIVRAETLLKNLKSYPAWVKTISNEVKEQIERVFGCLKEFYVWYVDSVKAVIAREIRTMRRA